MCRDGLWFTSMALVFKPSDFAIVNTDGTTDLDIESRILLRDNKDRKLELRLNYVSVLT
jgi:vacuolar protein sorting-associated protein 13A/C